MRLSARSQIEGTTTKVMKGATTRHVLVHIGNGKMRALSAVAFFTASLVAPTWAQEPLGCDKFKWPVQKEMEALRAPNLKNVAAGSDVSAVPFAGTVALVALNDANLPKPPERAPKSDTFAGHLSVATAAAGTYSISLSDAAWLDVLQDNRFLKPAAHSGVQGCEGIRKVVKFDLGSAPFIVQITGAPTERLNIAILPTE